MKKHYYFTLILGFCLFFIQNTTAQGSVKAYDFTSNYIEIPASASLNSPTITIEAWIKADAWATNIWENTIVSKEGWATGEQGYNLRCGANGNLNFIFGDGTWHDVASGPVMTAGRWYHVAGTYDGTTLRVYINGVEMNSLTYTSSISASTYNLNIGRMAYTPGGPRYFDGMIDEVRVWNVALPQSSIKEYMCKKMSIAHPQYFNLIGHWNMDAAGSVLDQSPNANNGTVFGATHVNSGAPIGDESVYVYNAIPNLTLANGTTDSVTITATAVYNTVHIYRVNGAPTNNVTNLDFVDNTQYYGIYADKTGTFSYTAKYNYGAANTFFTGAQNYARLGTRVNGNAASWASSIGTHDIPNSNMTASFTTTRELRLALDCPNTNLSPGNNQAFCAGDSVTFTDNGPATIRQWYNASGLIPGATGNSITTSVGGPYYLIVNDGVCLDTSQTVTVTVNPIPVADFGQLDSSFCDTDLVQTLSGSPVGGTFSGPGIFNGTFNPTMTGIGTFNLIYNVTVNGCSDADTFSISVYDVPNGPVINQTGIDLCTPPVVGQTYQWFLGATAIAGATGTCHTPIVNGSYTVVTTNVGGCEAVSSVFIVDDLALEEDVFGRQIIVSPNPTESWVSISTTNSFDEFSIILCDQQGRIVYNSDEKKNFFKINLSQFEKGLYMAQIIGNEGSTLKMIVLK